MDYEYTADEFFNVMLDIDKERKNYRDFSKK